MWRTVDSPAQVPPPDHGATERFLRYFRQDRARLAYLKWLAGMSAAYLARHAK